MSTIPYPDVIYLVAFLGAILSVAYLLGNAAGYAAGVAAGREAAQQQHAARARMRAVTEPDIRRATTQSH